MLVKKEREEQLPEPATNTVDLASPVAFGREVCGELPFAEKREWLVTNGIGGFASGTVAGVQTRRYHGLLVAALHPPLGRTLLLSAVAESVDYDDREYRLNTCRWGDGSVAPEGYRLIESFRLEAPFRSGHTHAPMRYWKKEFGWSKAPIRPMSPIKLFARRVPCPSRSEPL